MTDDEFINQYGAKTSYFQLLLLKSGDPEKFQSIKRKYEETLREHQKWEREREEEKLREWQKEEDRRTYETSCSRCGATYRRDRDGGTPLCPKCYDDFLEENKLG